MMTSSNGNIFHVTGPSHGESTGHRWIPHQRPVTPSLDIFLICVWTNDWVINRDAGDLTHWGRVTHICVSDLTITDSDNGLSPGRRQAIIWTNAGLFLIGPLGTNFSEILIEILAFSFKKMRLKVSSAKRRPFCLGPQCVMTDSSSL